MKSKKLVIGLLMLLALVFTTGTFAYWASSVAGDEQSQNATVTIGEGGELTTTVSFGTLASDGLTLVPTGYQDDTTTFASTTFTFPVQWDVDQDGADGIVGDLTVSIDAESLGTLTPAQIQAMFTIVVTTAPTTLTEGAGTSDVIVTVTFANEPATQSIYSQVALGTLSFDVTFNVTPQ